MEEFNSADILKNQNRKKKLATLEVGLFEISFVLIIIIVLFGLLNYFNILSLSTLYPNQLGFLPYQGKIPASNTQLTNSPSPMTYPSMPILNQATKNQILGYLKTVKAGNIPADSIETPNEFYGIFSGFDDTHIQLVTRKGVKNFLLANNLQVLKQSTPSAQTAKSVSTKEEAISYNVINKNTLLTDTQFGKILHVSLSDDLESVQTIFLSE